MADTKFKQRIRGEAGIQLPASTANRALIINGTNDIASSSVTDTELGYLSGVTSAVQTQLNAKLDENGGQLASNLDANNFTIQNLAAPTNPNDAATKNYVDTLAQGIQWKQPVKAATTANIVIATALNSGDVIDGVTLADGDRVLVKNQSAPAENGIYVVGAVPARASDMNVWAEVPAAAVFVEQGSTNADKGFVCTSDAGGTLGTTAINFTQFTNVLYTADGQGLELVGNEFSLELDGSTLSKSATGLKVATGGITDTEVSASAAINYSKLNLLDSVADQDIAVGADINREKLAPGVIDEVVINDVNGVLTSEPQLAPVRGGTGLDASGVTNGQLLIGNDAADGFSLATLTAGSGISITNGAGSITIAASPNPGDIGPTTFAAANNQVSPANVTGLAFANATVRSFVAQVNVVLDATTSAFEVFTIRGIQKGSSWDIDQTSTGDDAGVVFSITNAGQLQYVSSNAPGFVSLEISFRAETLPA